MMQAARRAGSSTRAMTWLNQAVALAAALLLALQCIAAVHHKDHHTGDSDRCASCIFLHHVPSGLPDLAPTLKRVRTANAYYLASTVFCQVQAHATLLIPKGQGPPQA
jgi:hypothetical protein